MLNYGAATNWAFARIGATTGSNEESSLEAFGRAMRDRRWTGSTRALWDCPDFGGLRCFSPLRG